MDIILEQLVWQARYIAYEKGRSSNVFKDCLIILNSDYPQNFSCVIRQLYNVRIMTICVSDIMRRCRLTTKYVYLVGSLVHTNATHSPLLSRNRQGE